jgi:rhodanese-related sulfurtransferase
MDMVARIGARELFLQLGDDEVLVVDCRSDADWQATPLHIPGALRMSFDELGESAHILPDDELIVLVGARSDSDDALHAWRVLRLRGRTSVALDGGLDGWMAEGFPVERHVSIPRHASAAQAVGAL